MLLTAFHITLCISVWMEEYMEMKTKNNTKKFFFAFFLNAHVCVDPGLKSVHCPHGYHRSLRHLQSILPGERSSFTKNLPVIALVIGRMLL